VPAARFTDAARTGGALALALLLGAACASAHRKASPQGGEPPAAPTARRRHPPPRAPAPQAYYQYLLAELAADRGERKEARRRLRLALLEDPDSADLRLRLAALWLQDGRRDKALQYVRQAERLAPDHALARVMHARLLRRSAPGRARTLLERAAQLGPRLAATHLERARLERWLRRFRGERAALLRVLRHHPEHPRALRELSQLALRQGRHREAQRWLSALQRAEPFAVYPRLARARLWLIRKRPRRAVSTLEAALEATADDLEVARELFRLWLLLERRDRAEDLIRLLEAHEAPTPLAFAAGLRARLGQWAKARALLSRVRRQDPHHGPALLQWAQWQLRRRGPEAAASVLRAVPRTSAAYAEAQAELASLRRAQGEPTAALAGLREALRKRPEAAFLWETLGFHLARRERRAAALRALDRARTLEGLVSGDPEHRYRRTLVLLDAGAWVEALRSARRLVRDDPADPRRLNLLGYSLAERGLRLGESVRLLRRAHRLDPLNPFILDSLAWARYQRRQVRSAVALLERAVRIDPWIPEAWHHLGDARRAAGRGLAARRAYRAALRCRPAVWVQAVLRGKLAPARRRRSSGPRSRPWWWRDGRR
jgi:tetratricopeptide (TPR) repeat protein